MSEKKAGIGTLTQTDKTYMAGLFDGEGCVTISRKKGDHYKRGYSYQLVATITNADKQVLERFHKEFKGYFVKRKSKNVWTLTFLCSKAITFLKVIYPYVLIKRKQMDIAFEFDRFIHSLGAHHHTEEQLNKKDEFALRIKHLNSNKGPWKQKQIIDCGGGKREVMA